MRMFDRLHRACNRFGRFASWLMVGLTTMLVVVLALGALQSRAQQGGWQPNNAVFATPKTCANCNTPGAVNGCTAPIPFQWSVGQCAPNPGTCCRTWPNYNCGVFYICGSGTNIVPCATFNLANQENMVNGVCP